MYKPSNINAARVVKLYLLARGSHEYGYLDLQGNEAECFSGILSTAHRLPIPKMDAAADLVEVFRQENERSEPPENS